jgi:hypothetical protein
MDASQLHHFGEAKNQNQITIYRMNFSISDSFMALAGVAILFASCGKTDTELPTVCTELGSETSVLADEIEAIAGTTVTITDVFCDNEELSEVRWDIHNAADHAHEEGESDEGFVLHSGTEWEVLETTSLTGTSNASSIALEIPLTARGVWDVVVSLVDEAGNAGPDVVTQMHIENEHLPEFTLSEVDGVDPGTWTGEPEWSAGSSITLSGMVEDADGVVDAFISLVREEDETAIWELSLEPNDVMELQFIVDAVIPADAQTGEYHLEMTATDAAGNAMETGFHVEVE